tara:strand:+ start:17 stop:496 length:480 start_codon:yes stop_codon:yes gene_type:complete
MKKNIILLFFVSILLLGCGYSAIYSKNNNLNFQITSMNFTGDREVNNILKTNLTRYTFAEKEIKQKLNIKTEFKKKILAKNVIGTPTDIEIIVNTILKTEILFQNGETKNYEFSYSEKNNVKNNDDTIEQKNYEKNVKNNLSASISDQIIFDLMNLNDN